MSKQISSRFSRRLFLEQSMLATAAVAATPTATLAAAGARRRASDVIRVAVVGVRGRGRAHVGAFLKSPDAEVAAICDPDDGVIQGAREAAPDARYERDIRVLLEDDSIDAISVATPNHWHSLATIWALQAGKHVYVEKPLSHDPFEGAQLVAAQAKTGLVVQHGTQARSHAAVRDAIAWMQAGGIGDVRLARGLCYKRRKSIGKVTEQQAPPATCDYDLWSGPVDPEASRALWRKHLHYDWHWDFATGNGDIGNQGVHQMDLARWGLGLDRHPDRVASCGGRLGYDDDGNTPNTQVAVYDYGEKQVVFEVRGLETDAYAVPGSGAHIGTIFHGTSGHLVIASYGKVVVFDLDGQPVQQFNGGSEQDHFQNFLDAVRAGDPSAVHASAREGHLSATLCHLGNASIRVGDQVPLGSDDEPFGGLQAGNEAFARMREHLAANGVAPGQAEFAAGPWLSVDTTAPEATTTGERSRAANGHLRHPNRPGFAVPRIG